MSSSSLTPVQTWLWSELEDLGIDGGIYSRHILDLLMSSKHSFDYRLDEKERSIFSKIAPSKKKKKKYSRRSSSFSACEEILWKKEIAVACLLSAADTKVNLEDTDKSVRNVVEELYSKLSGLNIFSDGKKSSIGDCSVNDWKRNGTPRKKNKNKERYEDAFPSLIGSKASSHDDSFSFGSVWNKGRKKTNLRYRCDSDSTAMTNPPSHSCRPSSYQQNIGNDALNIDHKSPVKKPQPYCLHPRHPKKRYNQRKHRSASTGFPTEFSPGVGNLRRMNRPRYSGRMPMKFDKNDKSRKNPEKSNSQKNKRGSDGNQQIRLQKRSGRKQKSTDAVSEAQNYYWQPSDYALLPSWMEATLIVPTTDSSNAWGIQPVIKFQEDDSPEDEISKEMPFSNCWFRDPDTGLLTFRPLKSRQDSSTASSHSNMSRSSSIFDEAEDHELIKDDHQVVKENPLSESWMWCPSPSLWEDGKQSPISRLDSVYKKELLSFGMESFADNLSCRMWEEYKTIFQDLQDMDSRGDLEISNAERRESVWPSKRNPSPLAPVGTVSKKHSHQSMFKPSFDTTSGIWANGPAESSIENPDIANVVSSDVSDHFRFDMDGQNFERKFDLWSETTPSHSLVHNSSSDDINSATFVKDNGHSLQSQLDADVQIFEKKFDLWREPAPTSNIIRNSNSDLATAGITTNNTGCSCKNEFHTDSQTFDLWCEAAPAPTIIRNSSFDDINAPSATSGSDLSHQNQMGPDSQNFGKKFDLWSETAPTPPIARNSSFESITASSVSKESVHRSESLESNIWKYSPLPQFWSSANDEIEWKKKSQFDDELSRLMLNGTFGYSCGGNINSWTSEKRKGSPIWGEALMPVEKSDECYEEEMVHTLVDALLSDLGFDIIIGSQKSETPEFLRMSPFSPLDDNFSEPLCFDFRSLLLETPIDHFSSPDNNPWQPKWNIDDLYADARAVHLPHFTSIDDLFVSIAAAEEVERQYGRLQASSKKKTFLDCVTENDAWKTSLRIGNTWQTISGIRPVNVIYSENKPEPYPQEKLVPTSTTHFIPINKSIGNDSPEFDPIVENAVSDTGTDFSDLGQDLQNKDEKMIIVNSVLEDPHFPVPKFKFDKFCKMVQDKSMQTTFEMAVQQDIPICQQFVLPRPPKANSR